MEQFKAITLKEKGEMIKVAVEEQTLTQLSPGDTIIEVAYSSINYKDALATQKNGGVVRQYPMIPGIDVVGTILETNATHLTVGQEVIVTGYRVGVSHTGGLSECVRVPSEWVVPLPEGLSLKEAAIFGTAGLTAMAAIAKLEKLGLAQQATDRILVTGATGGVGSLAIILLKALGFQHITAVTRKKDSVDYLLKLGAAEVLFSRDIIQEKRRVLDKQRFDFVIDTIGGEMVGELLPQLGYQGAIALCGNASGIKFDTTVLPFILRGVSLTGVDSVELSMASRLELWSRIASNVNHDQLVQLNISEIELEEVLETTSALLAGKHVGRTIVKLK
ncbi:YhdH/YhfP family quinone oxidoreductase [Vagococcus silagei]